MNLILIASSPRSLVNFRLPLIKQALILGYDVTVLAPFSKRHNLYENTLISLGVNTLSLPIKRRIFSPLSDLFSIIRSVFFLFRSAPSVIVPYTFKPILIASFAVFACRLFGRINNVYMVPLVTGLGSFFIDTSSSRTKQFLSLFIIRFYELAFSLSSFVFFQNPDDYEFMCSKNILKAKNKSLIKGVVVNGSGVDLNFYTPSPLPSSHNFLMLSRVINEKGVREYIEAARMVRSNYPNSRFFHAGAFDVSTSKDLKKLYLGALSSGDIVSLGLLEDVRQAIKNCRYFILPSYREGLPRSVLEAMAMGRPIITTTVPGCSQTVIDSFNGFLVPPKDSLSLSNSMIRLINMDESSISQMSCNSLVFSIQFDATEVAKSMLSEISSLFTT